MTMPSVHVVTINWNGLSDTLACLDSLKAQDYDNVKIHVVDNASEASEPAALAAAHPDVEILKQETNLGFCGGNNVAIRSAVTAGADYVLVLNNDTIVPPQLISELVAASNRIADVGAVSPLILSYPETDTVWFAGSAWEAETAGFRHLLAGCHRTEQRATEPIESLYACGCCMLVSAQVLEQIGLMDERYFAYYDEADWCSRMTEAGLRCYVIPSATVLHRVSRSTPGLISAYLMARNRLLWMKEHLPFGVRVRSYPYLIKETLWNILNVGGLSFGKQHISKKHSRAMLIALKDFLRGRFGRWPGSIDQMLNESKSEKGFPQPAQPPHSSKFPAADV
jgi:GT2 family glycosyltransferase